MKIEDWCYIGSESLIMPGVTIGEGALVAAGAVVTKSVPSYMVVGGNLARVLCTVDEYIKKNKKYNTHTKGKTEAEKRKILLELTDDMFIKNNRLCRIKQHIFGGFCQDLFHKRYIWGQQWHWLVF